MYSGTQSLPYDVCHAASTSSFKQALKTHLFKSAYIINTPPPPHLCVCVRECVCNILLYIFVFAVSTSVLVSYIIYMCAKIRVWSCLVTDNFGLFTEIAVCKFLRGWRSYGLKPFLFCPLYVFIYFSAAFLYDALCPRSC